MLIIFSFYIYFFNLFYYTLVIMNTCIVASAFVFYLEFYALYYLHVAFFFPTLQTNHYKPEMHFWIMMHLAE